MWGEVLYRAVWEGCVNHTLMRMDMIKTAMILAAGRGERLRPYTDDTPKPLLSVGGQSMLVRLLGQLRAAGIEKCVINICYLADQFIEELGDGSDFGLKIMWSPEPTMLGGGGGVVNAASLLGDEPFVLVSGDIVCDYDFCTLVKQDLRADNCLVHAVLVKNPTNHLCGDWALTDNRLNRTDAVKYTFGAIALIDPLLLKSAVSAPLSIGELFLVPIDNNQASGELFNGVYYNVGTVAEYDAVNVMMKGMT